MQKPLTVGELKKRIADLPDDMLISRGFNRIEFDVETEVVEVVTLGHQIKHRLTLPNTHSMINGWTGRKSKPFKVLRIG